VVPGIVVDMADLHTSVFHRGIFANTCPNDEYSGSACCLTCCCACFTFARIRSLEFGHGYWKSVFVFWLLAAMCNTMGHIKYYMKLLAGNGQQKLGGPEPHPPMNLLTFAASVCLIVMVASLREQYRKKYNIKAGRDGCGNSEDCCCAFWCMPCTLCQMAHHSDQAHGLKSGCDCGPAKPALDQQAAVDLLDQQRARDFISEDEHRAAVRKVLGFPAT
jgi:Cys-rich protein (TIGR01571 family)